MVFRTKQRVVASTTFTENSPWTETDSSSDRFQQAQHDTATSASDGESNDHEALKWDLTIIQLLSAASVVVAAGALWAAVLAYRGMD